MKFGHVFKALAPIAAVALATGLAGCDGSDIKINGEEGKKLSELDMSGKAPEELVLLGPDEVQVTTGDKLAITVDAAPEIADQLRFTLKDGTLGVLRKNKVFGSDGKVAVIRVTMPAPREITMAGSGKIVAAALASAAKITSAGSGTIETPNVKGDSIDLTIAGSGSYRAGGTVHSLKMTIAGSGSAALDTLKADSVKVTIAGSGDAVFASDGDVNADIMGSGEVRVKGRARCTVSSMGSGKLVCESGVTNRDDAKTPEEPEAPETN